MTWVNTASGWLPGVKLLLSGQKARSDDLRDPDPLVEALVRGVSTLRVSQMPFPENASRVARVRQHLGQCDFPLGNPVPNHLEEGRLVFVEYESRSGPVMSAARDGMHSASTLKFVSWNPSAARLSILGVAAPRSTPPTVDTNLAVAEVVHHDQDDIRLVVTSSCRRSQWQTRKRNQQTDRDSHAAPVCGQKVVSSLLIESIAYTCLLSTRTTRMAFDFGEPVDRHEIDIRGTRGSSPCSLSVSRRSS